MKIFMIKGVHDSGKTNLVTGVIKELTERGYQVGTIKDIHADDFRMDREGTDTYRHAEAGAQLVVAKGLDETDLMYRQRMAYDQILPFFTQDFLILEGNPGVECPNMVTGHDVADLEMRKDGNTLCFGGIIGESLSYYDGKPVFQTMTDIKKITDLIEVNAMENKMQEERKLKLSFDEEEVPLVPFVESLLRSTILAMMSELKGFDQNTRIKIEI